MTEQQQTPRYFYVNRRKPYVTYVLMGINIAVFLLVQVLKITGMNENVVLLTLGAKENTLITCGQYWRLLTACFLHADFMHVLSNLIGLYFWGPTIEQLLGRMRYLIVYIASGLMGSVFSYALSRSWSVGASGALFGIFGALLYFRTRHKQVFDRIFGMQVLVIIGINLVNGFISPGVDNLGHIGGLIGGFLSALSVGLFKEKPRWYQFLAALGTLLLFAALFLFGIFRWSAQLGIPPFTFIDLQF